MSTLLENLEKLETAKTDIAEALNNKGVKITDEDGFEDFANYINNLTVLADVDIPGIVAIGNSEYISYTTGDGVWKNRKSYSGDDVIYEKACYVNGRYIAVGANGSLCYSIDGVNWTHLTKIPDVDKLYSIAYGNGVYVCVGNSQKIYYSSDGEHWTLSNLVHEDSLDLALYDVCYGGNRFMCVGQRRSYYSIDGVNWTRVFISADYADSYWRSIRYGNDKFITWGHSTGSTYYSDVSYMDKDGTDWTKPNLDYKSNNYQVNCFDGEKFIMQGGTNSSNNLRYSYDGKTWTYTGKSPSGWIRDMCYFDGLYYTNTGHVSSDLSNWTLLAGLTGTQYYFTKGLITTKVER